MQSSELLEPLPPKTLQRCQQFMCGSYALHLFIAQDRKATTVIHIETCGEGLCVQHPSLGFAKANLDVLCTRCDAPMIGV
ncbi:hypothetical protein XH97_01405 [Bradyrhizobium sp. CCBAU 53380]|nr:hypothetical protein [Bradyrhizobium sp. CCBAU 53380]